MQNANMIPEIFQSSELSQTSVWAPVIGIFILFLGFNIRVEVKVQKDEEDKK